MPSKTVIVGSAVGLHARPATIIAEAAAAYDDEITLAVEGEEPVDAGSSLMIMTLGAEKGATVTVESENAEAVDAIPALIEQPLDGVSPPPLHGRAPRHPRGRGARPSVPPHLRRRVPGPSAGALLVSDPCRICGSRKPRRCSASVTTPCAAG